MKEDIKCLLIVALLMFLLIALFIWKFDQTASQCDHEMGYQCSASQTFNYNKKVD